MVKKALARMAIKLAQWTAKQQRERATRQDLAKALELACTSIADHCCPFDTEDTVWAECQGCDVTAGEPPVRHDIDRDVACWQRYFLEQARQQEVQA
jgi:hypothetical protein